MKSTLASQKDIKVFVKARNFIRRTNNHTHLIKSKINEVKEFVNKLFQSIATSLLDKTATFLFYRNEFTVIEAKSYNINLKNNF